MTDLTPPIPQEDTSFLDAILDWSEASIGSIDKETFARTWLPALTSEDKVIRENAWRAWEADVAKSFSLPVYVTEDGERKWLVPPVIGTINSGYTANPMSVNTQNQMVATMRNRLLANGDIAQDKMFEGIANADGTAADINKFYQLNWFVILRDFGHLKDESGKAVAATNVDAANGTDDVYEEGEYDF
ncbi:hypothetical protein CPT_Moabite_044 [Serratia phage Moabite]|uniref:Uncharacterized protein n=1 Tax=Serratia phage Moabite TaxID=2587814 RepID=A0A4Y5TNZ8_9CAUD|nr:hypothetical protein HWC48_gp044 [Serratia phage Moabite]QDB71076.1 hypothetical protein CPT_Moabite_044 [Serratia phage Moabite]UGO54261.1 hypothetical protein HAYMO_279 [Serratia phage vB_SmaM_Haymo]UQT03766.1 hypothetical protein KODAMA_02990 [Serratia phage vB_SmaM-Kodama]